VLLDEVEKADREVMNLFYQVFDKGVLNDGEGRAISFSNTVVVMTSNLATDLLTRAADPAAPVPPHDDLVELVKPTLRDYFKPALLARMTVVPYVPIRPEALGDIVRVKLDAVAARARASHAIALAFDDAVVGAIAARCREVESGARNVDHILRGSLLPLVSGTILGEMATGQPLGPLRVSVEPDGSFACRRDAR
jgi:type VI secretion system protein VasG